MKARITHSTAAVERVGRVNIEYRSTRLTNRLASEFGQWQGKYLTHLAEWSDAERFALGLLLTMAICERDDLVGIERSGEVYMTPLGSTLEWARPDGRRGARGLSTLVELACDAALDPRCGGHLQQALQAALVKLDSSLGKSEDAIAGAWGGSCPPNWWLPKRAPDRSWPRSRRTLTAGRSDLPGHPLESVLSVAGAR